MKLKIGLIREEKYPPDNRVVLTPQQCADLREEYPDIEIVAEPSPNRCFADEEMINAGVTLQVDLSDCDILMGVKEVPADKLIPGKTYFFFSHTRKKQAYNRQLMQALIAKKIRMIDYEALTYEDGKRMIGFGFYAGIVGAHNGLLTYGRKFDAFSLLPAHDCRSMQEMLDQYQDIKLPPVKIGLTGSGRVASGLLEIMHYADIESVEPEDFLKKKYDYPVYTHLKASSLYRNRETGEYDRNEFHEHPERYRCHFPAFTGVTDILLNGIYWDRKIPRLFEMEDIQDPGFRISVIADVTCDLEGSVPINLGAASIAEPVYGVRRSDFGKTSPYQPGNDVIDIMAVDNLPNELPRDASGHFGAHIIKYVFPELNRASSPLLDRATICSQGKLGPGFGYLEDYAYGKPGPFS